MSALKTKIDLSVTSAPPPPSRSRERGQSGRLERCLRLFLYLCVSVGVSLCLSGCVLSDPPLDFDLEPPEPDRSFSYLNDMSDDEPDMMMSVGGAEGGDTPQRCTPGERVDLCTVCGPDTSFIMPPNDPECEPVSCAELTSFYLERDDDGAERCMKAYATAAGGTCFRLGYCHTTTQTACEPQEPQELFKVYPGCADHSGCNSTGMPNVTRRPTGSSCHTFGTCDAEGRCDIGAGCAGFENAAGSPNNTYCSSTDNSCEVSVSVGSIQGVSQTSCLAFCTSARKMCVGAWRDNGACNKGNSISCEQNSPNLICACE